MGDWVRAWRSGTLAWAIIAIASCGDSASPSGEVDARAAAGAADANPRPQRPDGAVDVFAFSCTADLEAMTDDCDVPVTGDVDGASSTFTADIDMAAFTELVMTATICDPTGFVLLLSDSPTGNGGGGDAGTSSNDAEIQLASGTALTGFSNDFHPSGPATVLVDQPGYVNATGCTTVAWTVRDQVFGSDIGGFALESPHLLRINPPADLEGSPDALWHLGVNRTFGNPARDGTGVGRIDIGLR